ncbi:MAG: cupin domain-containing protein [Trueperaceae bacterium]
MKNRIRNVRRTGLLVAVALLLVVATTLTSTAWAQVTTKINVAHNVTFDSTTMARPFAVHQQLLELPPGAQSPVHMHGGPELILVLQGEVTFLLADSAQVVKLTAGENYLIPAETFLQVRNESGSDASFVVTFLLPQGAVLTTPR